MFENDLAYAEFYNTLVLLSLEAETFEVALSALKLQGLLTELYGKPL